MPDRATISLESWKALAAKGDAPKDQRLIKAYAGVVVKAEGDQAGGALRIRITTAQRDRDRDTISAAGWKLDNFLKNPVVLFAHNSRALPIARDEGLTVDESGIVGTPRFCDPEMNPLGPMVERMLRGGFLNAASVGFLPLVWQINEQERGYDFIEQELLEYSIVPIPANPGALVIARSAGIDITPLKDWLVQTLDEWPKDAPVPISREVAERSLQIVSRDPIQLTVPKDLTDRLATIETNLAALSEKVSAAATPPAPKSADPSDDDIVFELAEEPSEPTFDVDPDELRELVGAAVGPAVGDALTALTGRLD